MFVCAIVVVRAQTVCSPTAIKRWDGSGLPGDMGTGRAGSPTNLFTINGSSVEWIEHITGVYAYAGVNKGGFEPNPHASPVAGGNVQLDGLKAAVGVDYDRDVPGQDHRDLRYFAFTYDQANVYFYFRRPKNNTAQVSLYYFLDINVDGFMKTGEPVIKVTFNNSGSSIVMGYYSAVNSNGTAAGSYDATKGNVMSATTTRVKNIPNTSEWAVGSADGWNMPGSYNQLGNGVNLPALQVTNAIQEIFAAATLSDTHPDGVEPGYGVEFAVPFRYIGLYTATGLTAGTAINYNSVFTWHVSLGAGRAVEAQLRLSFLVVGTVAGEAFVGENRLNVPVEINARGQGGGLVRLGNRGGKRRQCQAPRGGGKQGQPRGTIARSQKPIFHHEVYIAG